MSQRSQNEQDLRATTESIRDDAERLARLEQAKSELDVADPRMKDLSIQAEQLTDEIEDKAEAERELSRAVERNDQSQPRN